MVTECTYQLASALRQILKWSLVPVVEPEVDQMTQTLEAQESLLMRERSSLLISQPRLGGKCGDYLQLGRPQVALVAEGWSPPQYIGRSG